MRSEEQNVVRRRQFCALCGQLMFEFYHSPDGHFGLVQPVEQSEQAGSHAVVHCQTCGARYRLLERVNAMGQPVERK